MQRVEDIIWVLVLIGVMINIHELGHFWAARIFKVRVEAFSFGFGPRLFGFRRGDTDYRVSAIPFGGYVKMAGEQYADDAAEAPPDSVLAKPRWQRLIIAFAGPFMNIVLAVGLLTGLYMVSYPQPSPADREAVIGGVAVDSPAAQAGIQAGDRIVAIDGVENPSWNDVQMKEIAGAYQAMQVTVERNGKREYLLLTPTLGPRGMGSAGWDKRGEVVLAAVEPGMPAEKAGLKAGDIIRSISGQPIDSTLRLQEMTKGSNGQPLVVEYERKGHKKSVTVQPVYEKKDGPARWMIGVGPGLKSHFVNKQLPLPAALSESLHENRKGAMLIVQFLKGVVEQRMSPKTITGPIGMAQLSGDAAREGADAFLGLMCQVSLNLAIFNLLPIPILDGGVILLLLVEILMRRDLSLNVKEAVFKVGFVFIMLVVAFVLYNDISKYLPAG